MSRIRSASARRIFDSRGKETIEVRLETADGVVGSVGAPSGASTGIHEVQALPKGVWRRRSPSSPAGSRPALVGRSTDDQAGWDAALHDVDGTPDFSHIGGNTASAASVALARTQAGATGQAALVVLHGPGSMGSSSPQSSATA